MRTPSSSRSGVPHILVLLATHNGMRFLEAQLDSILAQEAVSVRVVALDDASTDGTADWLRERAAAEPRLTVLKDDGTGGSSARNFARLIALARPKAGELISFADQDDLWQPRKLARHAFLLGDRPIDGVSSSVMSFHEGGKRTLVRKDFAQRDFDYLLESPGPGCTFLITPRLLALTAETLAADDFARRVDFHDSLIYAIARAHGWGWFIDSDPSVDYRQHDNNVMGSNVGVRSAFARLRLIREHWLRNHAILLTRVALRVTADESRAELERILALLKGRGIRNRFALAREASRMRRRPRDQRIIALLISIGVW